MELRSTIAKTLQRFALPRSKSSIGSFTIATSENSINTMDEKSEEVTTSSKRRPPPLSYNQHNRPSSHSSSAVRAHSTEIDKIPNKNKMDVVKKKSQIQRDLTFNDLHEITLDNHEETHQPSPTQSRSSLKAFLPKRFQSVNVSSSIDSISQNEIKQKKRRPSFRQFSQILKRSHSAHSDLAAVGGSTRHDSSLPMTSIEIESNPPAESNASLLKPICEEENLILHQKEIVTNDNRTPESLGISSSSSLSDRSSGSNKFSSTTNLSTKPEETSGVNPTINAPKIILPDPIQEHRRYLTKSNSYQNHVPDRSQPLKMATSEFERAQVQPIQSFVSDGENLNPNQQTNAVKLRDRNSKKKKVFRDFKPRISLPPDMKNNFLHRTASAHQSSSSDERHLPLKASESSRPFPSNSLSVQALDRSLNQSSSSLFAHLSRTEQRRSMLDLGWGKIESYIKLEKLGEGTYANVFKGTSNLRTGFVALKEIRLEQEEGAPCTALREVSLLKGLKHNNIVSLYDIIFDKTTLTLVFEYVEKDLKRYMEDCRNTLSIKNVRLFLFQLLRGLEFCHSKKILHRDLKPQNLLINERGELKLADFGLARIKSFPTKMYSNEVVTLWYRPPDVLLGSTEYSTHIDIWAVGCIFYEMTCGQALFAGSKVEDELHLIFKYLGTPTEETMPGVTSKPEFLALKAPIYPGESLNRSVPRLDPVGIDLLEKFLRYNPLSRISAQDAMNHPFFDCYPPEILKLKPEQSVLTLTEISLSKDHGSRFLGSSVIKTAVSKRSSVHL